MHSVGMLNVGFWHQPTLHSIKIRPPKQTFTSGRNWHISDDQTQHVQRTLQQLTLHCEWNQAIAPLIEMICPEI